MCLQFVFSWLLPVFYNSIMRDISNIAGNASRML